MGYGGRYSRWWLPDVCAGCSCLLEVLTVVKFQAARAFCIYTLPVGLLEFQPGTSYSMSRDSLQSRRWPGSGAGEVFVVGCELYGYLQGARESGLIRRLCPVQGQENATRTRENALHALFEIRVRSSPRRRTLSHTLVTRDNCHCKINSMRFYQIKS